MAQLDRLLSVVAGTRADSLHLAENEVAALIKDGATRPLTKSVLTATQLLGLLREIAPADAAAGLDAGRPAVFRYETADGAFVARATRDGDRWIASLRLE